MASSDASRRIAHLGFAFAVMLFFIGGLAVTTVAHRANDFAKRRAPGIARPERVTHPGRRELQTIVRGLMVFAEAVAEEALSFLWQTRTQ